jgi:hypothetical protein
MQVTPPHSVQRTASNPVPRAKLTRSQSSQRAIMDA